MAEAIFLDVLPKFGFSALEAGLSKFKSASAEAGKAAGDSLTGGSDAALKKLQESYTAAANTATKAAADVKRSTDEIDVSQRKVITSAGNVEVAIKKLAETYETYGAGTSQVIAAENRVVAAWAKSDAAAKVHQDTVLAADAAIAKSADATAAKVAAAAKVHEESAATTNTALVATSRAFNTVGAGMALGFTAAVAEAGKAAGNFEQSQMRLVSSAGETTQGLKIVSDGLLQLAGDTGTHLADLSRGMYTVESAGYRGADGLKVMTAAAQGAKAENADLTKVTDGLTTSMTDFGYKPEQAATVMSKLVTAVGESKANFEEFTGSLHSVEPVAAAAGLSLDEVYGALARITQSGTSADQASQNLASAIRSMQAPNNQQIAAMQQIGISADDVTSKLDKRGLTGTLAYLSDTVRNQLDPSGRISVGVLNENAQAAENAAGMIQQMSPAAASVAQAFANGTISRKDFTGAIKASNSEDAAQLQQFGVLETKLDGFSKQYTNGRAILQTYGQEMKALTGTVETYNTALQLAGTPEKIDETNKAIKAVSDTVTAAGQPVKGFDEATNTLNGKMDKAREAFHSAGVELGNTFLPTLTTAATDLAHVGHFLSEHKQILEDATYAVGIFGGAWAGVKIALAVGNTFTAIASGIDLVIGKFGLMGGAATVAAGEVDTAAATEVAAQGRVAVAAGEASTAVSGVGAAALKSAGYIATLALGAKQLYDYESAHQDKGDPTAIDRLNGDDHYVPSWVHAATLGIPVVGSWLNMHLPGEGENPNPPGGKDDGKVSGDYNSLNYSPALNGAAAPSVNAMPPMPNIDALTAAADAARPDITAPGSLSPEDAAAKAKAAKAPAGDKNDPIWISAADAKSGEKGSGTDVYNPFAQFQSGGFTPASLVGFATAFALNQALGNPYGKQLAAQKRGESPDSPLYVSQVDVDNAQTELQQAIHQYGPDSTQAQTASKKLAGTEASVGTQGGYYDPTTGGVTPRDPSVNGTGPQVNPGKGAEGWRGTVSDTFDKYAAAAGIPASQKQAWVDAAVRQIQTESGGNPGADNPNDSNGRGGTQHVAGLLQYLPSTFANSAQKLTGITDMMNPEAQIAGLFLSQHSASGGPVDIGNGIGWGPSRQPVDTSLVRPTAVQAPVPPSAPAPQTYGGNQPSGSPFGAPESLSDLRSLFTGGGGEGPTFKKSPAPAPPPPAPFGGSTDGLHYTDGQWFNGAGQPVRLSDYANGARPRSSGTSPFAPGGVLGGASPAAPGSSQFGGIGQPGRPGGAPNPQIGRFPVPQSVNQARIPGMNIAQAGAQAGAASRPSTPAANANVSQPSGGRAPTGGSGKGGGTTLGSTAASIAGPALDAIAPGAGIAAQKGGQLLDRAIGYGAQLAGIGVSGLLETFALNDSPLADPGKSVFGRLAGGIAGAHKSADNVAGQTQPPLKPPDQPDGSPASGNGSGPKPGPGTTGQPGAPLIGTMNVNHTGNPDGQRIATETDRALSSYGTGFGR